MAAALQNRALDVSGEVVSGEVTVSRMENDQQSNKSERPKMVGTTSGLPMRALYLLSDTLSVLGSIFLAEILSQLPHLPYLHPISSVQAKGYVMLAIGLLLVGWLQRSYGAIPPKPVRQFRGWVLGALSVWLGTTIVLKLFGTFQISLFCKLGVGAFLAFLVAAFCRATCRSLFGTADWWGTRVIVVSTESLSLDTQLQLAREPQWGLRPVGYVSDVPSTAISSDIAPWLGSINELEVVAKASKVNRAMMAVDSFEHELFVALATRTQSQLRHWIIIPPLEGFPSLWLEECEAARLPAISVTNQLTNPGAYAAKRFIDLSITAFAGLLLLPLIAALALLIKVTTGASAFFDSERIGRGGKRFYAKKFCTMRPNADKLLAEYLARNPQEAAEWSSTYKLKNDPRITWIGNLLRQTSLDELPQLWNVLIGDMSLVGPRPILPDEAEKYGSSYMHYREVLPGITGLWQVSGRNNTSYQERIELVDYYVLNWSVWLDLYILACTVKVVLFKEGAY
ncbi:exopolysaccharide biosynthesis polyprenyl glycosylphosphotransferase [Aureliella helgolandensis]|uniref:UDP-glucose:undecaprenyl-phosphate glucose-1-phosphate transferase n=1 Tax=Aureliella helgolandensis TaxID=2527968 RepID=A0A518G812_9BACT|nr:exopolysaccharide biosynthesis polyprenyl glycosylphosphotransferase [Aureliella helgolandensis]QDV24719.1 UDP-glucose:undecaprenyl-phosphate glucose-1-phosphate transferase [Aureliella helgolandensis]